jgi:NAD(P)H-hydrate epimerase
MELAGTRLADLARHLMRGSLAERCVAVLAGAGNNGGGGLVAVRHLANAGARVSVYLAAPPSGPVPTAQLEMLRGMGLPVQVGVAPAPEDLAGCDLIVDALLGYGVYGAPHGIVAEMIIRANIAPRPVLALDLPSGLDADDAGPYDPCIHATATLALGLPKRGLTLETALPVIGDLYLADIGIPAGIFKDVGARVGMLFATGAIVRLRRTPLAGDLLPSPIGFWRLSEENDAQAID